MGITWKTSRIDAARIYLNGIKLAGQNPGCYPAEFIGIVGAQAVKVFNLEVATTGLTNSETRRIVIGIKRE